MTEIELNILNWIYKNLKCDFLDFLMPIVTHLGTGGVFWIIIAIILIITKKYRRAGIIMLSGMLLGLIIGNLIIKNLVARTRPYDINTNVKLLTSKPFEYSFPSGHTLVSVISATILTLTSKKFAIFAIPIALLVAFSRLYLYVHFPTDVLGAIILGVAIGVFTFFYANKIMDNKKLRR